MINFYLTTYPDYSTAYPENFPWIFSASARTTFRINRVTFDSDFIYTKSSVREYAFLTFYVTMIKIVEGANL